MPLFLDSTWDIGLSDMGVKIIVTWDIAFSEIRLPTLGKISNIAMLLFFIFFLFSTYNKDTASKPRLYIAGLPNS